MIFSRIQEIRQYRKLTQADVADWFSISKQSWSRKERGTEGGLGPAELQTFLEKTEIDARYIFNQIDSIEEADLRRKKTIIKDYSDLVNVISDLKDKVFSVKEKDPVAYRVSINNTLHKVVERIQYLDGSMLERIDSLIIGFLTSESEKKG